LFSNDLNVNHHFEEVIDLLSHLGDPPSYLTHFRIIGTSPR